MTPEATTLRRQAEFSADGRYRLFLLRQWDAQAPLLAWVGLNPSTADAKVDDPTIRRVMAFSRREGAGGCLMLNLSTIRATDPRDLVRRFHHGGDDTFWADAIMDSMDRFRPPRVVCCWGATVNRADELVRRAQSLGDVLSVAPSVPSTWCLGRTLDDAPRHPLYISKDAPLTPW